MRMRICTCVPLSVPHERRTGRQTTRQSGHGERIRRDIVYLLVACLTSQQHTSVSQGRIRLRQFYVLPDWGRSCSSIFLISPSGSVLTPGQPIPALTVYCQVPCRVATGVPVFFLNHWYDSTRKNPHSTSGNRTPGQSLSSRTP